MWTVQGHISLPAGLPVRAGNILSSSKKTGYMLIPNWISGNHLEWLCVQFQGIYNRDYSIPFTFSADFSFLKNFGIIRSAGVEVNGQPIGVSTTNDYPKVDIDQIPIGPARNGVQQTRSLRDGDRIVGQIWLTAIDWNAVQQGLAPMPQGFFQQQQGGGQPGPGAQPNLGAMPFGGGQPPQGGGNPPLLNAPQQGGGNQPVMGGVVCPACGANVPMAAFCNACGSPLQQQPPQQPPAAPAFHAAILSQDPGQSAFANPNNPNGPTPSQWRVDGGPWHGWQIEAGHQLELIFGQDINQAQTLEVQTWNAQAGQWAATNPASVTVRA